MFILQNAFENNVLPAPIQMRALRLWLKALFCKVEPPRKFWILDPISCTCARCTRWSNVTPRIRKLFPPQDEQWLAALEVSSLEITHINISPSRRSKNCTTPKKICTRLAWSVYHPEGGDVSDNLSNFLNLKFKPAEKSNTQGVAQILILLHSENVKSPKWCQSINEEFSWEKYQKAALLSMFSDSVAKERSPQFVQQRDDNFCQKTFLFSMNKHSAQEL